MLQAPEWLQWAVGHDTMSQVPEWGQAAGAAGAESSQSQQG